MPDVPAAERYVLLAAEADRAAPGLVGAWIAEPPRVPPTRRELPVLAAEADALARDAGAGFLAAQLRALAVACRLRSGVELPFAEVVAAAVGVRARPDDVAEAHAAVDELLPGKGDPGERLRAWQERRAVPPDRVPAVARRILLEARRRTTEVVPLPEDAVELATATGRPWSGENAYLRGFRSRVELNGDEPLTLARLVDLLCHEGYPGHHAERVRLEAAAREGRVECGIALAVSPAAVPSEGLASMAEELVLSDEDFAGLCGELGASPAVVDEELRERRAGAALQRLRTVNTNAALLLHERGAGAGEVEAYLVELGLRTPARARSIVRWMRDPLRAAYLFAYPAGVSLVERLIGADGRREALRQLLEVPWAGA